MTRRIVEVRGRTYQIALDDPPPPGARLWGLVGARLTDEMTGGPPAGAITVEVPEGFAGMSPRVAVGGIVGLAGFPANVFSRLGSQFYDVPLRVRAEGYLPGAATVRVAQNAAFPAEFAPPPVAEIALHREPTVLHGRTVRASGMTTTPVAGAVVRVTGIWSRPPSASASAPPDPPNVVSLQPPLYAPRDAVAGELRLRNMIPVPDAPADRKGLLEEAPDGADTILLSNRIGLSVVNTLLIDAGNPDREEFIAIAAIEGGPSPDLPARVTLQHGLFHLHRRGVPVQRVNVQPLGAAHPLTVDAQAGDTCVFVNNVAGLSANDVVRLSGAGAGATAPDEHHRLGLFSATSDADGFYRLPPLSRIAQVRLRAENPPLSPVQLDGFRPDYNLRENRLDIVFR